MCHDFVTILFESIESPYRFDVVRSYPGDSDNELRIPGVYLGRL